jgi:F0F1-type ATP synthase membrane subunit b/b'
MAKTNYTFEKRQKELAKQKKQAEKLLKKAAGKSEQTDQPITPADDQIAG